MGDLILDPRQIDLMDELRRRQRTCMTCLGSGAVRGVYSHHERQCTVCGGTGLTDVRYYPRNRGEMEHAG